MVSKPRNNYAKDEGGGAGRRMPRRPRKPLHSILADALHSLEPSGPNGFEGFVASLLTELTGVRFLPPRAGLQHGRDLESSYADQAVVFVECKRYGASTDLSQRDLVAEIDIALRSEPRLDLYVVATTRGQDAFLRNELSSKARKEGIDFEMLSCGSEQAPEELDILCAAYPPVVRRFIPSTHAAMGDVTAYLGRVAESSGFQSKLEGLSRRFLSQNVGLATFRNWS